MLSGTCSSPNRYMPSSSTSWLPINELTEPPASRRLLAEAHDQVDHADPVRPAVDEVAEEPQLGLTTGPVPFLVDQLGDVQGSGQLCEVPVHVTHDVHRASIRVHVRDDK